MFRHVIFHIHVLVDLWEVDVCQISYRCVSRLVEVDVSQRSCLGHVIFHVHVLVDLWEVDVSQRSCLGHVIFHIHVVGS